MAFDVIVTEISSTLFMGQSVMQDPLTALILLHLHQQLSQVITQEVLLFGLQGCLVVIYCLSNSGLMSIRFFMFII